MLRCFFLLFLNIFWYNTQIETDKESLLMPLITNTTTKDSIRKSTEQRYILFTDPMLNVGFLSYSNFGVEKILYTDNENCLHIPFMSGEFEFKKTKHAYMYSFSDYFMDADTILELKELKHVREGYDTIYILPIIDNKDPELDHVLQKEGIDTVLEWFDSEDPFLNVFNQIHKSLGNNPDDFII